MSKWNQESVRTLIKEILARNCEQIGMSLADIGNDDDLYASGTIDSFGLVELLVELEDRTGLEAELHMAILKNDVTDDASPLALSINQLSQALVQD